MASSSAKVLSFLGGGVIAAGAIAYVAGVLDPWLYGKPAELAALPAPATADPTPEPAAPKEERLPAVEGAAPAPSAPAAPAKPAETATTPVPPTFDVVRVEANGSMVIAGKAASEALVQALANIPVAGTEIGNTHAASAGDFAIILDNPLKPGDYEIRLRSTDKAGNAVDSIETAIVSVPETAGGQVLAMIETPGQASEIITAPEPVKPAELGTEPVKPAESGTGPVKPAESGTDPAKPADVAAADPQKPADVAATPEPSKPADAGSDEAGDKPADVAAADPAKPAGEGEVNAAPSEPQKPAGEKPAEVAAAEPNAPASPPPAAQTSGRVVVEAVEIEGRKIFVAGAADAGHTVRVYASEIHLGDAKASQESRFLVEAEKDLPVGSYTIRADLLGADGVEVIARAVVPFEREPGEMIAAVAPELQTPPTGEKPADAAAQPPASPAADKPAEVAANDPAPPNPAAPLPPPAGSNVDPSKPADAAAAEPPAPAKPAEVAAADPAKPAEPAPDATAPKLAAVKSAVIIRRGDSLWRISRRVYGQGMRYSTLYLANQDQIRDPDRIWPGQVFSVPEKTEQGEAADWKALGDQATTRTE